jgi:molybdate transport system regulatory protein
MSARRPPAPPGLRIRLVLAPGFMIGPGKADLLQGIGETGSIAAAGRGMKMSYKRAWLLVETLNAGFRAPLVTATRGGKSRGGAELTDLGREVLAAYRALEAKAAAAAGAEIATLHSAAALPETETGNPGRA